MLEYDRIDVPEKVDINKSNASKEFDISHYWYFLDKGFKCVTTALQWFPWFNAKSFEF